MRNLLAAIGCAVLLSACTIGSGGPNQALATASMTGAEITRLTRQLCGNTVPNGPCAPGAVITTEEKNSIKLKISQAREAVGIANELKRAGDDTGAQTKLQQADAVLAFIEQLLLARQGD